MKEVRRGEKKKDGQEGKRGKRKKKKRRRSHRHASYAIHFSFFMNSYYFFPIVVKRYMHKVLVSSYQI